MSKGWTSEIEARFLLLPKEFRFINLFEIITSIMYILSWCQLRLNFYIFILIFFFSL